jgi:hypothetical protein
MTNIACSVHRQAFHFTTTVSKRVDAILQLGEAIHVRDGCGDRVSGLVTKRMSDNMVSL